MPKENIVLSYRFDELSKEAQEHVISTWRNDDRYPWGDENKNTLDAFANTFLIEIKDWEYGGHNYVNWTHSKSNIENLTGVRLRTYLLDHYYATLYQGKYYSIWKDGKLKTRRSKVLIERASCPFTGYCADDDILDPIYRFINKPNNQITLEDIMQDCLNSWLSACQKDYEYWLSEEAIREDIAANEYEFTIDGKSF